MNHVEVKTSELVGPALDWAVLAALEVNGNQSYWKSQMLERPQSYTFRPSTDWSQGGPLIDEYDVGLAKMEYGDWCAAANCTEVSAFNDTGPTPLIAAMRAIVAAKLGDTVQIPSELIQ